MVENNKFGQYGENPPGGTCNFQSQRHIFLWCLSSLGRLSLSKFGCDKSMLILKDQRGLQYEVLMAASYANHLPAL